MLLARVWQAWRVNVNDIMFEGCQVRGCKGFAGVKGKCAAGLLQKTKLNDTIHKASKA